MKHGHHHLRSRPCSPAPLPRYSELSAVRSCERRGVTTFGRAPSLAWNHRLTSPDGDCPHSQTRMVSFHTGINWWKNAGDRRALKPLPSAGGAQRKPCCSMSTPVSSSPVGAPRHARRRPLQPAWGRWGEGLRAEQIPCAPSANRSLPPASGRLYRAGWDWGNRAPTSGHSLQARIDAPAHPAVSRARGCSLKRRTPSRPRLCRGVIGPPACSVMGDVAPVG